jgi:hypothetical protein
MNWPEICFRPWSHSTKLGLTEGFEANLFQEVQVAVRLPKLTLIRLPA